MKRILPLCLVVFILLGYMFPVQPVKADQGTEVTYTDAQLSQIGAWALSNNLITGITDEYDFGNLPIRAPMTPADFLIALGESIVTKDPTPLIQFGYNLREDLINELKADLNDLWEGAKDFFYELFFGSPQTTLSIDDFIQPSLQFGLDHLDKVLATQGDGDVPALPSDYSWFQNANNLFIYGLDCYNSLSWYTTSYGDNFARCTFFSSGIVTGTKNHHTSDGSNQNFSGKILTPKLTFNVTYHPENNDDSKYILEYTSYTLINYDGNAPSSPRQSNRIQVVSGKINPAFVNDVEYSIRTTFPSIDILLNYIYDNFANFTMYVDGVLWIGGNPPLPPISSGQLTYSNGEPAIREFPTGTQIDWDTLYNKIYQAIVDGLVLDFSDIDDCIVDVNGQPAVASLRLVRTDYDKLYLEQYANDINLPLFPFTLTTGEAQAVVGGTVGNIISPYNPSNPALNEDSVIPSDIARVLYIGVFLTLFACIINRLLE